MTPASGEQYCPSCSQLVSRVASTCAHCGSVLDGAGGLEGGSGSADGSSRHRASVFEFSLAYPFSNDWGPLLVGCGLALFFFLVVPVVALGGYAVRVGRAAARGDESIPDYDDWGQLLVNGLLYAVAVLPVSVFGVAVVVGLVLAGWQLEGGALVALVLLAFLFGLVVSVVSQAIVPTLIATGSVTETYSGLAFVKAAFTTDFLLGFAFLVVVQLVVGTVVSTVTSVLVFTVVGIPLAIGVYIVAQAYTTYLVWALWGYVCWDAEDNPVLGPLDAGTTLDIEL